MFLSTVGGDHPLPMTREQSPIFVKRITSRTLLRTCRVAVSQPNQTTVTGKTLENIIVSSSSILVASNSVDVTFSTPLMRSVGSTRRSAELKISVHSVWFSSFFYSFPQRNVYYKLKPHFLLPIRILVTHLSGLLHLLIWNELSTIPFKIVISANWSSALSCMIEALGTTVHKCTCT